MVEVKAGDGGVGTESGIEYSVGDRDFSGISIVMLLSPDDGVTGVISTEFELDVVGTDSSTTIVFEFALEGEGLGELGVGRGHRACCKN